MGLSGAPRSLTKTNGDGALALMAAEFALHPAGQRMSAWGAVLDPADVQGCGFEASAGPRHVCDLIAIGGRSGGRDFASRPYSDVTGVRRCF